MQANRRNFGAPTRYAQRLAKNPLALCRYLFQHGRVEGDEFVVGSIQDQPGASLRVKLSGPKAGQWADFNPDYGHHGDLLNLIYHRKGCRSFGEAMREADIFLRTPMDYVTVSTHENSGKRSLSSADKRRVALRIWKQRRSILGTPAEYYFRRRGFNPPTLSAYGFIPKLYEPDTKQYFPGLIYQFTDSAGVFAGIHRLYLTPDGRPVEMDDPKKALGSPRGAAIWHTPPSAVALLAEGAEDGLAIVTAVPRASIASAVSASFLPLVELPNRVTAVLLAQQNDAAGEAATRRFKARMATHRPALRIATAVSQHKDWDLDCRNLGFAEVAHRLRKTVTAIATAA